MMKVWNFEFHLLTHNVWGQIKQDLTHAILHGVIWNPFVHSNTRRFILFVFPTSQSFALVSFTAPHAAVSQRY